MRTVCDNLSAARRRVHFPPRQPTKLFAELASHYAFEPSIALPGEGHEKHGNSLETSLAEGGFDELAIRRSLAAFQPPDEVTVPERLRSYGVERASLADYDRLLQRSGS